MALVLKHQSIETFLARLREDYRNSSGDRTALLASFVTSRIASGDLTDTQLRTAFNLSAGAWNALKTKMQTLVTSRNNLRGAIGE